KRVEVKLLLATIQAEDLKDLDSAEATIHRLVEQPQHAPKNVCFALYSLADWHLKFGQDQECAVRALQKVHDLLAASEFALGAAQRIAHLGNAESRAEAQKLFPVPQASGRLGLRDTARHAAFE